MYSKFVKAKLNFVYKRAVIISNNDLVRADKYTTDLFISLWNDLIKGRYNHPFNEWFIGYVMKYLYNKSIHND